VLNFRYHIVSLVAVFLALGVGVIMGSAVIDSTTIDVLEDQSAQLQGRLDRAEGRVGELETLVSRMREEQELLADQGSEVLLDRRLEDVPVVIITAQGVDAEAFERLRELLTRADAAVLGSIRLRDRMNVRDDAERRDLAEAIGRSAGLSASVLQQEALELVARTAAGRVPGPADPDVDAADPGLSVLAEAGFVDIEPSDGTTASVLAAPPPGAHVLVLWSSDAEVTTERVALPLVRALAAHPGAPVVVAAPSAPVESDPGAEAERPLTLVPAIRAEETLAGAVSTVDNVDTFPGHMAAVLAIELEGRGAHGHFGTADGAQRLLPAAPEPATGG
jgi:hypothetical protein